MPAYVCPCECETVWILRSVRYYNPVFYLGKPQNLSEPKSCFSLVKAQSPSEVWP